MFNNWLPGGELWFAASANFCSVNTLTGVAQGPMWCHWMWRWEEELRMGPISLEQLLQQREFCFNVHILRYPPTADEGIYKAGFRDQNQRKKPLQRKRKRRFQGQEDSWPLGKGEHSSMATGDNEGSRCKWQGWGNSHLLFLLVKKEARSSIKRDRGSEM